MMNKEQCEAWTRLVDLSTSSRWFDGVILAANAELTALRQQRDELLAAANCARDMIAAARTTTRQHLIMNQSGRFHFKELEMLIIDHLQKTGYLRPNPALAQDRDKVHIGNMIIDLILLAENMGLDFTECLAAAYSTRTGATK